MNSTATTFNSRLKKFIVPVAIIILIGALAFSLTQKAKMPDISFTTIDGIKMSTAALDGKIVLVNFWATDCPGCISEMPELIKTHEKYQAQGFEVLAVSMPYDPIDQVKNYSKKNNLPFIITHDDSGALSSKFQDVRVTPTSFILDQQGRVISKIVGEINFTALHQLLDAQLANSAKGS
ncbi:MAG: peroxiredoxin family protein [Methylophilaceae bacterium]|nr:TlpA disulfide reductase family protein [Methyloradius sp.]